MCGGGAGVTLRSTGLTVVTQPVPARESEKTARGRMRLMKDAEGLFPFRDGIADMLDNFSGVGG